MTVVNSVVFDLSSIRRRYLMDSSSFLFIIVVKRNRNMTKAQTPRVVADSQKVSSPPPFQRHLCHAPRSWDTFSFRQRETHRVEPRVYSLSLMSMCVCLNLRAEILRLNRMSSSRYERPLSSGRPK